MSTFGQRGRAKVLGCFSAKVKTALTKALFFVILISIKAKELAPMVFGVSSARSGLACKATREVCMKLRSTEVRELPEGRRVDLGASVVTHVLNRAGVPHVQVRYKKTGELQLFAVSQIAGDLTPARKRAVRQAFMG